MTFKEEALPKSCKTWDFSTFFCITSYFLQFLFVSTKKKDFWNPCWNEISTSQAKLSFGKLWILVQLPTLCFGGWGQRTGDQPRPRPRWGPRPTKTYTGLTWTRSKWVGETDQDQDPTPSSPSLKIIDIRMKWKWKWYFDMVIMMTLCLCRTMRWERRLLRHGIAQWTKSRRKVQKGFSSQNLLDVCIVLPKLDTYVSNT